MSVKIDSISSRSCLYFHLYADEVF